MEAREPPGHNESGRRPFRPARRSAAPLIWALPAKLIPGVGNRLQKRKGA
jgi:hypothetical protein